MYLSLSQMRERDFLFKEGNCIMTKVRLTEETSLVRKALDFSTGKEVEKCRYAFFPGTQLPASEPEIVIKAYDSLHFQYPDTAMFMRNVDMSEKDEILAQWKELGEPTVIFVCTKAYKKFKEELPQIPVISIYEKMLELHISGGCNHDDYYVLDPEEVADEEDMKAAVRELADGMGVKIHELDEEGDYPYLVYSMSKRDELKNSGKDAVHMMEFIYGMGASNTHMIHEHSHDHGEGGHEPVLVEREAECDGNCASCTALCGEKPAPPAPLPTEEEKLANLKELKQMMLALYWNEM